VQEVISPVVVGGGVNVGLGVPLGTPGSVHPQRRMHAPTRHTIRRNRRVFFMAEWIFLRGDKGFLMR
jgi:hypothetical protein